MPHQRPGSLVLELYPTVDYLHVATAFVEKSALAFGFSELDCMALSLATEEIFVYLSRCLNLEKPVEIRSSSGGYFMRVEFEVAVDGFNLRAFNVAAGISLEDDDSLDELGLFIASRKVDRFRLTETESGGVRLTLIREKTYPVTPAIRLADCPVLENYQISAPDPEQAKLMAALVHDRFPASQVPKTFAFAGKVVDMLAAGHYTAACAIGPSGQMGGAIVWQWAGTKMVEFFGPYLFGQPADSSMAGELIDACINSIAKSPAVALICRMPTDFIPRRQFETLGQLTIFDPRGASVSQPTFFRQMQEDMGTTVTCHPELEAFLTDQYRRLVLPRHIRPAVDAGEAQAEFSVLAADFDRSRNMATLHPIQAGADAAANLQRHLDMFRNASISNLFFELDLGLAWQAGFGAVLLKTGFVPRLILPYAGRADVAVFQWQEGR